MHTDKYISYYFQIEKNMTVVTDFLLIRNKTEFRLIYNKKENYHYDHIPDFSQLRICRTNPLSEEAIFAWKMRTLLNRMKNKFYDFNFLSYGWLYSQFTLTHQDFQVCHRAKKNCSKVAKLTGEMSWNEWKIIFRILQFPVFKIWAILYWNSETFCVLSNVDSTNWRLELRLYENFTSLPSILSEK